MTSSEKEDHNRTEGEEIKVPCSECSGKTYHKVLLSIDKSGEEHGGDFDFYWDAHYQIIQCRL